MKCDEYREALQKALDARDPASLAPEFGAHAGSCPACAAYAAEMIGIDKQLAFMERFSVSESLLTSLKTIPHSSAPPVIGWQPYLIRALVYTLPALILWGISSLTPGAVQLSIDLALTSVGVLIFLISALWPVIVGER